MASWSPPVASADQPLLIGQPTLGVDLGDERDGGAVPVPVGTGVAGPVTSVRKAGDLSEDSLGCGASATHGAALSSRSVTAASPGWGTPVGGPGRQAVPTRGLPWGIRGG
jgi:hypothetical protein